MKAHTSHILISLCYAYIAGIVGNMVFPLSSAAIPLVIGAVVVCGILSAAWWAYARRRHATHTWWSIVLGIAFFLGGYARHAAVHTLTDQRIGQIIIDDAGNAYYKGQHTFDHPVRLRVEKISDEQSIATLQFYGQAHIMYPVTNAHGIAELDTRGRWTMYAVTSPVESDVLMIDSTHERGQRFDIPQPFTTLTDVRATGDGPAVFDVYRISSHASSFARPGRFRPAVTILGRVVEDPSVYERRAHVRVAPSFIQYTQGGAFYPVDGGDVQVILHDTDAAFTAFAVTEAYGRHVQLKGELRAPSGPPNPGGFDQRAYLHNHNVFGTVFLRRGAQGAEGMVPVPLPDGSYARGNRLVAFSLGLRDQLVSVIKQTLPMPHSSFIGAITLGMRFSFAHVPSLFSDYYTRLHEGMTHAEYRTGDFVRRGTELTIAEEFRRAGTNHVLAVSGLHVTIITAMCVGIFMLLRMPKKMFAPLVIMALVIFAIITGARPSTLRAVIMNSLFLLTWAYLERSFRSAALFGVAIAGFLILVDNPLMIVDPSFTLSFGAILSLVLMTGPFYAMLCRLKGNMFLAALVCISLTTIIAIRAIYVFYALEFWVLYSGVWLGVFLLVHLITRLWGNVTSLGFQDIPGKIGGFFAAQFAIQVGMMIPLSAYYFAQWPIGGAYANILAIPLVGIVLQLGIIAGLIGLIPYIGIYIALLMNATNWVLSTFFLYISHIVAVTFPYPSVPRPTIGMLVAYYAVCFIFVYHKGCERHIARITDRFARGRTWLPRVTLVFCAVALLSGAYGIGRIVRGRSGTAARITVLAVRYGSAISVETPQGHALLIDGGSVQYGDRSFNNALREILPFLSREGMLRLDALVLTAPGAQRSGGIPYILDTLPVDNVFVPPGIYGVHSTLTEKDLLPYTDPRGERAWHTRNFHAIVGNWRWPMRPSLLSVLRAREENVVMRMLARNPVVHELSSGTVVWEEDDDAGNTFIVRCIHTAPAADGSGRVAIIEITHGDTTILIPSDSSFAGLAHVYAQYEREGRRIDVLLLPSHGAVVPPEVQQIDVAYATELQDMLLPLIARISPKYIVNEYGDPLPMRPETYRMLRRAHALTRQMITTHFPDIRYLSTDTDQAIMISTNGEDVTLVTQREKVYGAGEGVGEGVGDIGYGF